MLEFKIRLPVSCLNSNFRKEFSIKILVSSDKALPMGLLEKAKI